ncbi:response regulator transcription factor [Trinickia caryophylli]|uniref:Two component transcriptional regulator, LuxR family n=1 Tax=Trinickia caryophylli TaxID=28094 RepID=A0A1X7E2H0_TRICW|nr:response regulator transcription factor [Trinickia caryophylli]PMS14044.1 DNA-binding response regulator [Trinickia caryophylli]TRX17739.1 response regulator transcription factor [Trinickia caryophylli]WQE11500.1 response regulator transcription factor [Trinickia caryophylli]SMF25866.1 two component transcriptional regulator, LuxR family [Trinickia caryophylli]GLU32664.1 DNA-binding response regulator [Trinickia caryophylli]
MNGGGISVLLVDDHAVVREGYRRLLELSGSLSVCGEAGDASEAYQRFCALAPDVVVMDVSLPGASGIEAMRRMLAREPDARILIFSVHEDLLFVRRALDAGALGYVTKASAPDALVDAVRTVARGTTYLSPDISRSLAMRAAAIDGMPGRQLSAREFEVLRMLVQGLTLPTIAEKLGLSQKTVANHQSSIRQKFGVDNGVQLAQIANRLGLQLTGSSSPA